MLGSACGEEPAVESHAMRLQGQMPGVLVENVFEMLQHPARSEDRFERVVAAADERSAEYLVAARPGRGRPKVGQTQLARGRQLGEKFVQVRDELEKLRSGTEDQLSGYRRFFVHKDRQV